MQFLFIHSVGLLKNNSFLLIYVIMYTVHIICNLSYKIYVQYQLFSSLNTHTHIVFFPSLPSVGIGIHEDISFTYTDDRDVYFAHLLIYEILPGQNNAHQQRYYYFIIIIEHPQKQRDIYLYKKHISITKEKTKN